MSNEEEEIKKYGAMLPHSFKHPSGKFRVLITDEMRHDFGEAYVKDLKERMKKNGSNTSENVVQG